MREGIWRVYRAHMRDDQVERYLVARFVFYGEQITALEDHSGFVEELAPDGKVTGRVLAKLENMSHSPYYEFYHEDDIQNGEHEHLTPEVV